MNEFLNPKSMVTPGVAGAMVMLISNAIVSQFPEAAFRWVIVLLSFLVGTVVFYAVTLPILQRLAFWAVNSLIIFSVGIGTSNVASNVAVNVQQHGGVSGFLEQYDFLPGVIPSAYAQTPAGTEKSPTAQKSSATKTVKPTTSPEMSCDAERDSLRLELSQAKERLAALTKQTVTAPKASVVSSEKSILLENRTAKSGFFNRW
jgi:hypothetical protein